MNDALKASILDEMIAASQAKIAEMEADAATERRFLTSLQQRRAALSCEPLLSREPAHPPASNGTHAAPAPSDRTEEGRIPQLIVAAIRDAGKSLTVDEIVKAVEARGGASKAKKGVRAVVFSALGRRDDLFVRLGRGLYDLAQRRPDLAGNANGG